MGSVVSPSPGLVAAIGALFIAAGGLCLVLQRQRLAARFIAAGIAAALAGSFVSVAIANVSGPAAREMISAVVAFAVGISVVSGALLPAVAIFSAALLIALVLPSLESSISFLVRVTADHWLIVLIGIAIPFVAIAVVLGGMRGLRGYTLATGRGRTFQRGLVAILDWAIGDRRRFKRTNRHIGGLGTTRRARHGRGPTKI